MKVAIKISKSAAILAGREHYGYAVAEVPLADLTPDERAVLAEADHCGADAAAIGADVDLPRAFGGCGSATAAVLAVLPEATPEAVRGAVRRIAAIRRDEAAAVAAKRAEADRRNAARAIASAEADRRNAAATAAAEAAKAAAEAERAAGLTRLAEWSREHGSLTTRLRLEEGYDCWVSSARGDYADAVVARVRGDLADAPDGGETEDRECPDAAEILALRAVRERCGDDATAALVRTTYEPDDDDADGPRVTEIWLTIPVPGCRGVSRYLSVH